MPVSGKSQDGRLLSKRIAVWVGDHHKTWFRRMGGRRPAETRVSCHMGERFWDLDYSRYYLFLKPQVNEGIQLIQRQLHYPGITGTYLAEEYHADAKQGFCSVGAFSSHIQKASSTSQRGHDHHCKYFGSTLKKEDSL